MRLGQHVVYFALRPPAAVAEQVRTIIAPRLRREGLTGRLVPADRLHVSLIGLGCFPRVPSQVVEMACRVAEAIAGRPFRLAFNRLASWGRGDGQRAVVLSGDDGVIGVETLHDALHAALAARGMVRGRPRPFWPHMTVLHDRRELPETFVGPVNWLVEDFVLIDSLHGEGRHELVGRWRLQPQAQLVAQ